MGMLKANLHVTHPHPSTHIVAFGIAFDSHIVSASLLFSLQCVAHNLNGWIKR